jgi:hypothetical protein
VLLSQNIPDATIVSLATQITAIMSFFLARNLRIARERAWDQTVASRGKGTEFWQPYVEEWTNPPQVDERWAGMEGVKGRAMTFALKKGIFCCSCLNILITDRVIPFEVLLFPVHAVPIFGLFISAWFKSYDTARYLHRPVSPRNI